MDSIHAPGKRAFGEQQEKLAAAYLMKHGLNLVDVNYRCRVGEIDLIMRDRSQLVFVEVRYRRSSKFGSPAETVDPRKQRKLIHAAQLYLLTLHLTDTTSCRFDIVGITPGTDPNTLRFDWIQDAFSGC